MGPEWLSGEAENEISCEENATPKFAAGESPNVVIAEKEEEVLEQLSDLLDTGKLWKVPTITPAELEDSSKVLRRALTLAHDYVENYFEVKRLASAQEPTTKKAATKQLSTCAKEAGCVTWGLPLDTVFGLAVGYTKANATAIGYGRRNQLLALKRQAKNGPCTPNQMQNLSWLDWTGRDIRMRWQSLGNLSQAEAKVQYCCMVEEDCDDWTFYLLNEKRLLDEILSIEWHRQQAERAREEERIKILEEKRLAAEAAQKEREREKEQEREREREKERENSNNSDQSDQDHSTGSEGPTALNTMSVDDDITPLTYDQWMAVAVQDPDSRLVVFSKEVLVARLPVKAAGVTAWWEFCVAKYDIGFAVTFEMESDWLADEPHSSLDQSDSLEVTPLGLAPSGSKNVPNERTHEREAVSPAAANDEILASVVSEGPKSRNHSPETLHKQEQARCEDGRANRSADASLMTPAGEKNVVQILPLLRQRAAKTVMRGSHTAPGPGTYLLHFDNRHSVLRTKIVYLQMFCNDQ